MTNRKEKTKAVAICEGCGEVVPVRVWPDESIHPIGSGESCCGESEYNVLESGDSSPAFD